MVTTTLWNLLENRDTSIEDLTQHYLYLFTYLVDACKNGGDFMKRTFPSLTGVAFNGNKISESLIKASTYDTDVTQFLF